MGEFAAHTGTRHLVAVIVARILNPEPQTPNLNFVSYLPKSPEPPNTVMTGSLGFGVVVWGLGFSIQKGSTFRV